MYKLRISSRAENEIKKISHPHQKAIILALAEIKKNMEYIPRFIEVKFQNTYDKLFLI